MTEIYEHPEYILSIIRDNFSISLQLYYYDNNEQWEYYNNTCENLVSILRSFDDYESQIKPKLIDLVQSLSQENKYSVWVV